MLSMMLQDSRNEANVRDLLALVGKLGRKQRLLGVDPGEKHIGLALSDVSLTIASPLKVLRRGKFASTLEGFKVVVAEHDIGALIVGLPLQMSGTVGSRAMSSRDLAHRLGRGLGLSFLLWDERYSTKAVGHVLRESSATRKRREALVDKLAAAHILQGALDCAKGVSSELVSRTPQGA